MSSRRRRIALSLNLLLLHLVWTGTPGGCTPGTAMPHHSATMGAMYGALGPAIGEPMGDEHGSCSGDMLGGGCACMVGCATTSLLASPPLPITATQRTHSPRVLTAFRAPRALPAPLPPPPRA